jgi:hypothetical protein
MKAPSGRRGPEWVALSLSFLDTRSHYVAQTDLELTILLPQPPECWDYKCCRLPHGSSLLIRTLVRGFRPIWDVDPLLTCTNTSSYQVS